MRILRPAALAFAVGACATGAPTMTHRTTEERRASYLAHRGDFDYLLGDWQFSAENPDMGKFGGFWSAARVHAGPVSHVVDEYRIVDDSGRIRFASITVRAYNVHVGRWELMSAADGTGVQDIGTAQKVGDEMHVEQTFGASARWPELWRIRYYNIRQDSFSWVADRSFDRGASWERNFMKLEARRIGPPRALSLMIGERPDVSRRR